MFRIGEFSQMGRTTIKALRYYDEAGLLKPERTDRYTGYRLYTTDQLILLHRIQALRQTGLSVGDIRAILQGRDAAPILEKRRREIQAQLAQSRLQLSRLTFLLQQKEEDSFMSYAATIKNLPGCIVYSRELTLPSHDAYFEAIPAIGRAIAERYPDLKCASPEYCFIVSLDGEYRETDIHIEYCEAVDRMKPDFDGIVFKRIEPVTVVSVMHKGPYALLPRACAFALKWIEENGYTVTGAPRESYIDGIWNKEDERDWLTEIQIPIQKEP